VILDKLLELDPANTAITATANSTNTIDLGAGRDLAPSEKLSLYIALLQTFTAAGAATLTVQILGSVDNSTFTVYAQTDAIPKANLVAGGKIEVPFPYIPPHAAGLPRYFKLNYVVATGPFTAGQVQANLVLDRQGNIAYAPGIVVTN
jgi:hypothetical protein